MDIKRLGRFWTIGKRVLGDQAGNLSRRAGWQFVHLAIDDHSRVAYAEILPREGPSECTAFLRRATAWYLEQGVTIERVLTDNGNGYRSFAWRDTCAELGIQRRYTRPRRPQTNGKAEALVKTLLREWAYRFTYPTSRHRAQALPGYLRWYNQHRPHGSLDGQPPISRVSQVRGTHI
jgi:transposase InsO family protein